MNTGIPAEHIAIRTADVNELKNVDLLSPDCPVRYIITVDALKEGWDCPFAYILASLANKTSQVDVEQILGRILRLPYTVEHRAKALNMSYVLTSSNDFNDAVQQIIRGLNSAGFSDRDCRLAETKGEHLKNDDSQEKIELGAAWRNAAGNQYRYYMVFRDEENLPHGAVSMGQFVETVEAL